MTTSQREPASQRTPPPARSRRLRSAVGAAVVCAGAMIQSACHDGAAMKGRVVSLAEFSRDSDSVASAPEMPAPPDAVRSKDAAPASTQAVSSSDSSSLPAPPPPTILPARPLKPGGEVVVESVIGQVSGRPIFVDAFLEPISDQLRREGERLSTNEFIASAREIIGRRLFEVVLNELFLAEAEAALTPQQKMGLLAFLKDLQEKNIAERGGTVFGAQQKVAAEQDMTLEEFQETQKKEVLISNLLSERIRPRVIVSWRDVEREYERRRAEFNPPAEVTIQRLRLDNETQKDQIAQVKAELAAGKPFTSVVQELGLSGSVAPLGQGALPMSAGGLSQIPDISTDYQPALAKMKAEQGQTSEAIELSGRTVWLYIEKIDQPPAKTIYEVQEQLIAQLRAQRENEERQKYINTLFEKGIYDEMDVMAKNVLAVAVLRYSRE